MHLCHQCIQSYCCCASGKPYGPRASYQNLCTTESYRLCSPEGSELQIKSQAGDNSCLWWLPSLCCSIWQSWACRETLKWAGWWLQWPRMSTFPWWRLLSCLSASTVPLLHVMFQNEHHIALQKLTGFRKGCVTHKIAHYNCRTNQSKISWVLFKVLIHSRIARQIVLHLQLN